MAKDWAFVDRFTSDKPFELPADAFPPPEWINTVSVSQADDVRPTDPVIWLTHKAVTRCYPWGKVVDVEQTPEGSKRNSSGC